MLLVAVVAAVVLLDQVTKVVVRGAMHPGQSLPVVENVFHLTYVRNTGAAFGLMPGHRPLFVLTSVLVLAAIALYWWRARPRSLVLAIALGLVSGGAIGNLIDRVVAGRVTDFFDFFIWPVFNIADIGIVVGAAGLFVWALFAPVGPVDAEGEVSSVPGEPEGSGESPLARMPGEFER